MTFTKRIYFFLLLSISIAIPPLSVATPVLAEDLYVISNPGIKLSADEIREVFLGEKQFAGSVKIIPIDNHLVQTAFLSKVVKMEQAKYETSWTKKSFRDGLTPPASKSGDAEVINFVKSTPGAVGYVSVKPDGVTLIQKY